VALSEGLAVVYLLYLEFLDLLLEAAQVFLVLEAQRVAQRRQAADVEAVLLSCVLEALLL